MVDLLNLQAEIVRGETDKEIEYQVGTIRESFRMDKRISRQGASFDLQYK